MHDTNHSNVLTRNLATCTSTHEQTHSYLIIHIHIRNIRTSIALKRRIKLTCGAPIKMATQEGFQTPPRVCLPCSCVSVDTDEVHPAILTTTAWSTARIQCAHCLI